MDKPSTSLKDKKKKEHEGPSGTTLNIAPHSSYVGQHYEQRRLNYIKEHDTPFITRCKLRGDKDFLAFEEAANTPAEVQRKVEQDKRPGDYVGKVSSLTNIRPPETEYLKHAKQGGRKNLLSMNDLPKQNSQEQRDRVEKFKTSRNPDNRPGRPIPYKTDNQAQGPWDLKTPRTGIKPIKGAENDDRFAPPPPPTISASEERQKIKARNQSQTPPYNSDSLSYWQRPKDFDKKPTLDDRFKGYK